MSSPRRPGGRRRRDPLALVQPALPLLTVYFALSALYAWQASRHPVPTIFTDELELTQLARSIAETGEPARRGEPYGLASLAAYVLAPVWWLGTSTASYAAAKLLFVLAMTAAVFPAYALARMVVPHWYALGAAGASAAVPALAYSPILVEEPLAYPLSTVGLWLVARALVAPSWGGIALAAVASIAAGLARTQLAILLAVLILGLLWIGWESAAVRRWRSTWTGWDRVGAAALVIGILLGFSALMGHVSTSWRETTGFFKERVFENAAWATGALAIGVGVLPLLAGIAALARPKREPFDPRTRAFVVTSVAALIVFLWYAGIKGAFLSTTFSTLVVERNLIYLYPVLFAATALAFNRGVGRLWAVAGATVVTLYVVLDVPLRLDQYPYYDAHGLSIAAFANRELGWDEGAIENAFLAVCALSLAVVLALRFLRRDSTASTAIAGVAAVAVLSWSLTAEVYAAAGERDFSQRFARNFPKPYDWVDRATDGRSVVVIGQRISDPTGVHLTEFFNSSIRKMWSVDGTAPRPGPILTPDLAAADGTLTPPPETEYALALNGLALQAPVVARRGNNVLYRLDGQPLRLQDAVIGIESDGWIVGTSEERIARASYTRYDVSGDGPGFAVVKLSRVGWCGGGPAGEATVRIGPVGIGPDKQPAIERVTETRTAKVENCVATGVVLRAPTVPWRVEVEISPTFSPNEIVPTHSDRRQLGAVLEAGFRPLFGDS